MSGVRRTAHPLAAYILHRYDWSESSLILDLFTRERGRVAVAAKGAKRPYSQLRPVLLPFQKMHVLLGRAGADEAADIVTLRSAEWAGGGPMLAGAALFDAYEATLPALAAAEDAGSQAALRAFELTLLRETGVLPDLGLVTQSAEAVDERGRYTLQPEAGVVEQRTGEPALSGSALAHLQAALDHGSLPALQAACLPVLQPLRAPLRALLHYHLGTPLLRTRQVMLDVQKLLDTKAHSA